jgi:WD40 repeat protein
MLLRRESNQAIINLSDSALLGVGGEARIYTLPQAPDLAAKIYHQPDKTYAHKLAAMLANPPRDPGQGHTSIIWPLELLRSLDAQHQVVGFLMPRVHRMRCVIDFYHPGTRRKRTPLFSYAYLHRTARNLAAAVGALHAGGYVIGDVNESNVLVSDTALVTLVDTDSFQVRDPQTGVVYRSPVGKAEFTPPELQGKTFAAIDRLPEHDLFGLAVLIFQLLMEGTHPYAGVFTGAGEPPPIEARILAGHFPYGAGRSMPYRPMTTAPPFGLLAPSLRQLFIRCFVTGFRNPAARPSAHEWQDALKEAEETLRPCVVNGQHLFGQHLPTCPWCKRAQQLKGRDPFPSLDAIRRGQHLQLLPRKAKRIIHPTYSTQRAMAARSAYAASQALVPAYTPVLGLMGQPPAPPQPSLFTKLWNATSVGLTFFVVLLMLQTFCSPGFQALTEAARTGAWVAPARAPLPSKRPQRVLTGHAGPIKTLAVAPDSQTIATGSTDHTVKLWDVMTGRLKLTLTGSQDDLSALAFSPDGRLIAGGDYDAALNLWGTQTGQLKRTLRQQRAVITALAFAPDGQSLVACSRDQTLVQWDLKTGQPLWQGSWASRWVSSVAFSADGQLILAADDHGAVIIFEPQSGETKHQFVRYKHVNPPFERLRTLTVSPDGKLVAFAFLSGAIELWDLASEKLVRTMRDSAGVINTLSFSPDSQCLLSGNHNGTYSKWAIATGGKLHSWRAHSSGVKLLTFSPDGRWIISTADGTPYSVNVFDR